MPPAKTLATVLIPKVQTFRLRLPRGARFLGVTVLTDPEVQKHVRPEHGAIWDSPEWPVLHLMHDVGEAETNYHTFYIHPANSVTEPLPLQTIGTFTVHGHLVFHVFEVPDDQRTPDPDKTTTHPTSAQS